MAEPESQHTTEVYKSLIQISVEGLKLLAVLNGGAVVALLAYLGNIATKVTSPPDMRWPMGVYLFGLLFCGLAFFTSYLTQLKRYNEFFGHPAGSHQKWLYCSMVFALLSLILFGISSLMAATRFR